MNRLLVKYVSVVLLSLVATVASAQVEYPPEQWLSGTLPVLYVNTDSCKPITSKTEYIAGNYYLDPNGVAGVKAFGSAESPLPLEIRGRGNASWIYASYRKKPYKIKLDKKAALMGMPKSKHWALMAHWEDGSVFLKDETGFEFSRRIGLAWTPRQRPVELVLNGEYMGLYFITENVRVESTRVNVVEQDDGETNPEAITGGWLLETDNYPDTKQIKMTAGNGDLLRVTYKSPEELSPEQSSYLKNLIQRADSLVYVADVWDRGWEKVIDIDSLAAFYIVNEIVDNVESFSGSCYMHKDRGEGTKLIFGPVWDYGNAFGHMPLTLDCFLYENSAIRRHWIVPIARFPRFQQRVRLLWRTKHADLFDTFNDSVMAFTEPLRQAEIKDGQRWERAYINNSMESRRTRYVNFINRKVAFLEQEWSTTKCTLAEALEQKDGSHEFSDELHVACIYGGRFFITDNNGHWMAIALDENTQEISRYKTLRAKTVKGYIANTSTNPTLVLDEKPRVSLRDASVRIDQVYLTEPISLKGNTVVRIRGIYRDHALWSEEKLNGQQISVDVPKGLDLDQLEEGACYQMTGILFLKHEVEQPQWSDYEFHPIKCVQRTDAINDINGQTREVKSRVYVSAEGRVGTQPFAGFNVVIITYSNGEQEVKRMMK